MAGRKPGRRKKGLKNKPLKVQGAPTGAGSKTKPTHGGAPGGLEAPGPSDPSDSPLRRFAARYWRGIAWGVAIVGVACLYLVLKAFSLHAYVGDEHLYLYQAKLVSEGVAPYSGFAAAHPPLQMVFTALLFKLFGYSFLMMRSLPALWYLAGGLALAWMVRRELGGAASVAAAAIFLLSHEPLRASSHYTGVNMTSALLVGAVLAYRYEALRTTALLCVCAVFTRIYAIPGVAVLTLFAVAVKPREGLRLIAWGGAMGAAAFVAVGIFTGFGDMVDNLLLYHHQKTPMRPAQLSGILDNLLFHNATPLLLFGLSLVALIVVLAYRKRHRGLPEVPGLVGLSAAIVLVYAVLLLTMDRVWPYYFVPPLGFSAVVSGWLLSRLAKGAVTLARAHGNPFRAGMSPALAVGGAALTALFVAGYQLSPRLESRLGYWDEEMAKPPEARGKTYEFQPTILPDLIEAWARYLLWRDERVVGEEYHTFNFVLWHESRVFDVVDEVVESIREETSEEGEIFGDSGSVPLFALLSGRRIAANAVDTNIQQFRSKNADPEELITKIDNDKTEMIILRQNFGVSGVQAVRRLVAAKYKRVKRVRSNQGRVFHLFKRVAGKVNAP